MSGGESVDRLRQAAAQERTWSCCAHCSTVRGHVVPPEGHGLPCDVKGCQFPYRSIRREDAR